MPERGLLVLAADGSALQGLWRTPAGPGPFPCVLCVHGLTLTKALFDEASGAFAERGLASLRLDLRGHGDSGGRLQDQGFSDQCDDVGRGLLALAGLPEADPARVGLLGFSMGGAMGAVVAASAGVKALALWSPLLKAGVWNGLRREDYGPSKDGLRPIWDGLWVNERLFAEAEALDPFTRALAWPGPVLVCHGGKDRNHPQAVARELAEARVEAARPVASYYPPASGHRWLPAADRRLRDGLTAAFFAAVL